MKQTMLAQPLLFAMFAWLLFELRKRRSVLQQLARELRSHLPVFSAETVRGREAEFIRDRVPHRLPQTLLLLVAYGVLLIAAWWLAR
jgi:hypothetical protein